MKYIIFLMPLALLCWQPAKAQKKAIPVTLAVFNEATAIPFTRLLTTPIHPGIQAGSGFFYHQRQRSQLFQSFNVGYIFHNRLYHGFFVNTELGYDYKFNFGLNLKTSLGIGYLHTFSTQKEYQFKNGVYESRPDRGNRRAMLSLGTGLGYRLQKNNFHSPEVFMMYQGWAEYPYSPGFIPVMTHANMQLGTKFFIEK
jgi:hypothetical protein